MRTIVSAWAALPSNQISTLDALFAASVALGFAFALLLVLASGRVPRLRIGRIRRIGLIPKLRRKAMLWEGVPGAIPVGIGSFLIGFGLTGLFLRPVTVPFWNITIALEAGILFALGFLWFVSRYFGGGAKESTGNALVGVTARVSLEIPAGGSGRIAFERDGRRSVMPARTCNGQALPRDAQAFVVGVEGGTALVEEM